MVKTLRRIAPDFYVITDDKAPVQDKDYVFYDGNVRRYVKFTDGAPRIGMLRVTHSSVALENGEFKTLKELSQDKIDNFFRMVVPDDDLHKLARILMDFEGKELTVDEAFLVSSMKEDLEHGFSYTLSHFIHMVMFFLSQEQWPIVLEDDGRIAMSIPFSHDNKVIIDKFTRLHFDENFKPVINEPPGS